MLLECPRKALVKLINSRLLRGGPEMTSFNNGGGDLQHDDVTQIQFPFSGGDLQYDDVTQIQFPFLS